MRTIWNNEIDSLKKMLSKHMTTTQIGEQYGVSRQRIYQVLTKYGLETVGNKRKNILRSRGHKAYWLNNILIHRGVPKVERFKILDTIIIPDVCPILGLELNYHGTGIEGGSKRESSPSIDQLIPGGGYTIDNIAIMSWRANRIKNDGTAEEHMKIANFLIGKEIP